MYRYSADEIHFNLMAIVSDMKMLHQRHIDELLKKIEVGRTTDNLQLHRIDIISCAVLRCQHWNTPLAV